MARAKKKPVGRKVGSGKRPAGRRPRITTETRSFEMSVHAGKVVFNSNSGRGNGFTKGKGNFWWTIDDPGLQFELTFARDECIGFTSATSNWPFQEDPAPGTTSSTGRVSEFRGKARVFGLFSYSVAVFDAAGNQVADSDPVIIIGRV